MKLFGLYFKRTYQGIGQPVDPNSKLAKLYAENDAHLIFGIHVPRSVEALADPAYSKSLLRHERLNKRPKGTLD